jgi:hypothetical protein
MFGGGVRKSSSEKEPATDYHSIPFILPISLAPAIGYTIDELITFNP